MKLRYNGWSRDQKIWYVISDVRYIWCILHYERYKWVESFVRFVEAYVIRVFVLSKFVLQGKIYTKDIPASVKAAGVENFLKPKIRCQGITTELFGGCALSNKIA